MTFNATEFNIGEKDITPTGTVLTFMADTLAAAVNSCLYTMRLKNGNAIIGASGKTVICGGVGYALKAAN